MKWICDICGYEHEGANPPDVCPVCGVDSSHFAAAAPAAAAGDPDAVKTSIRQITYGMFVVTTEADGFINGQAANSVIQLTSQPDQLAVCLNKGNYTTELVLKSGRLAVNVIGLDGYDIIANFGFSSGRERNKFKDFEPVLRNGLPCLEKDAVSGMLCRVVSKMDVGSHYLFVAAVEDAFVNRAKEGVRPMTYGEFRSMKSGKISGVLAGKDEKKAAAAPAAAVADGKYVCRICGYVYDPAVEGIPFKDLPDSYACPVCGAPKADFDPLA